MVQQRIFNASPERPFLFELTGAAKGFLLSEGSDPKYGARHVKRVIERLLIQPICSLIATRQVRGGDCIPGRLGACMRSLHFHQATGRASVPARNRVTLKIHTRACAHGK